LASGAGVLGEWPVFEGLRDVAWGTFRHVYGPATDVPHLLRQWVGDDSDASRDAVRRLWSSLIHQGEIHPTAAVVAPFFVEALRSGPPHVSADAYFLVDYLLDPAVGVWRADGFSPDVDHEQPRCYWAAAEALDALLGYLDPTTALPLAAMLDESLVTRQVAQTLWWFPQDAASIAEAVRERLAQTRDPKDRVPLVLCLAMQARHTGDTSDWPLFVDVGRSDHPGEALVGALALARVRHPAAGGQLQRLLDALEWPIELGYPLEEFRGTLATGEQLVADGLLAATIPDPSDPAELTIQQLAITEAVTDRAVDNIDDLLDFYGL
jgi:hypothetical protein